MSHILPTIETVGRRCLWGLSHSEGVEFGPPSRLVPHGEDPAQVTHTDCWTHAWKYAQAHGLEYWEGVCELNGQWQVHAWCMQNGEVVEVTKGYEDATRYKGFKLSPTAEIITRSWDDDPHRSGILEAFLTVTDWPTTRKMVIDTDW